MSESCSEDNGREDKNYLDQEAVESTSVNEEDITNLVGRLEDDFLSDDYNTDSLYGGPPTPSVASSNTDTTSGSSQSTSDLML